MARKLFLDGTAGRKKAKGGKQQTLFGLPFWGNHRGERGEEDREKKQNKPRPKINRATRLLLLGYDSRKKKYEALEEGLEASVSCITHAIGFQLF